MRTRRACYGYGLPGALVLGIGNEWRGDDAVGLLIARRIAARRLPGVGVEEGPPDVSALLDRWRGWSNVILVDAVVSGAAPGVRHRLDLRGGARRGGVMPVSTHGWGLADAVDLARVLERLPRRLILIGVERGQFGLGNGLSPAVQQAISEVEQQILRELTRIRHYGHPHRREHCRSLECRTGRPWRRGRHRGGRHPRGRAPRA